MKFIFCCGSGFQHASVPHLPRGWPGSLEWAGAEEEPAEVARGWRGNALLTESRPRQRQDIPRICKIVNTSGFVEKGVSSLHFNLR